MKYYIVRIYKPTNIKEYKRYKCIDGFTTRKDLCWQFSKQGALKIIERLKYQHRINIDKFDFTIEAAE